MQLLDLPAPEVIEVFDFETIKQRKLDLVTSILANKGIKYIPNESDDLMTMIEADAYEDMLLRTRINNAVKGGLLAFAKGADLDHLGASRYGVVRLEGSKPYASFTFNLSTVFPYDVNLPRGLHLTDGKGANAILLNDLSITSGNTTVSGVVELQEFVATSDIKTEIIVTPLPYVITAVQESPFNHGADAEDDERFRERIWKGRERKSTAGSLLTYEYYAFSADARITAVKIINDSAGVVKVYLLSVDGAADQIMINRVSNVLNAEERRPLTDTVEVYSGIIKDVRIEADIVLYDLTYEPEVRTLIEKRVAKNTLIFGKSLSLSKIYGLLESENVKDITLLAPTASIDIAANEVIRVSTDNLTLNFSEVQ